MSVHRAHPGWLVAPLFAPLLGAKLLLEAEGIGQFLFASAWILGLANLLFWGSRHARLEVNHSMFSFRSFWGHTRSVEAAHIKSFQPAPSTRKGLGRTWLLETQHGQTFVVEGVHLLSESSRAQLAEELRQAAPSADLGL
ncbi:MAG: hypothetical protein ACPHK8_02785 [Thermoplasmatota archaeon]